MIVFYNIPRSVPPRVRRVQGCGGRQLPRKLQNFNSGSCNLYCIILYNDVLYYTCYVVVCSSILYYTIPRSAPLARSGEQEVAGPQPKENCKISILGVVNDTVLYYTIFYYIILYYTKVGPARPPERGVRGSGNPLENCKIWILGVWRPGRLKASSSGSCKLYCIILMHLWWLELGRL